MMAPLKKPKAVPRKQKVMPESATKISKETSLSSHPTKDLVDERHKENQPPAEDAEAKADEECKQDEDAAHAPLGTLVTRMKSMLRRKTVSEKKIEKKRRRYENLERMDTMHWTEM
jgi:hypothetical protein